MKSILLFALLNVAPLNAALAECNSVELHNPTRPFKEDYGFCLAAFVDASYTCGYIQQEDVTLCQTRTEYPDFLIKWDGRVGYVLNDEGTLLAKMFIRAPGSVTVILSNGHRGDCTANGGVVTWCE